jgi:hypothetical protein
MIKTITNVSSKNNNDNVEKNLFQLPILKFIEFNDDNDININDNIETINNVDNSAFEKLKNIVDVNHDKKLVEKFDNLQNILTSKLMFCVKCRKKTESNKIKESLTKNNKKIRKAFCNICGTKKTQFFK